MGGRSVQLARVFGIRIGADPSWFIVLFLLVWFLSDDYKTLYPDEEGKAFFLATLSALLFFLSIVLHELGHAVVAIRNGIGIAGIDLWMFGGIARMRRDTQSPGVELKVAIAGPLVTLAIAAGCIGGGSLAYGHDFWDAAVFDTHTGASATGAVLGYLGFINTVLLGFNLLPAFPLDGGRIARAIAWWRTGDRTAATRFAARLGRGFAYVFAGLGIFLALQGALVSGIWLVFIAIFLSQAARSAEVQTAISSRIEGMTVGDVMDTEPVTLPAQTKLDRALDDFFLRYRWPWFPVVDATGRFLGLVSRQKVEEVPEELRPGSSVDQVTSFETANAYRIGIDEPLEALLGSEGLQRIGALMAVDADGVLRGVVTIDQVRRALRPTTRPA
jgi:Zn-dependent protease